jgi:uncharacterized protein (TIGR00297 family)
LPALASPLTHLEAAIILAIIAALSLKLKFLDFKGVIASIVIGYVIIVLGGLNYFAILLAFFIISSMVTRLRVKAVGELHIDKDWIRGWRNVLANGLAPTLAILIPRILSCDERIMAAGYLGAVGTAFADTLATEIGLFYRGKPRLITSLEKVEKGTPGAVSPYGYLGCIIALIILGAFRLPHPLPLPLHLPLPLPLPLPCLYAGVLIVSGRGPRSDEPAARGPGG